MSPTNPSHVMPYSPITQGGGLRGMGPSQATPAVQGPFTADTTEPAQAGSGTGTSRFSHFARTRSTVPDQQGYSRENLPHILFQLDQGRRVDANRPRRVVIVNGEQRIGPNDRNVHELDCLPDWISAYVDGWLLELWWRLDLNMTYDHMIARMDEDEVDEENERIAGERGAEKPGKKSTVKKSQRKNKEPWFEKPKGERFNGHTFNNCLN